MLENQSNHSTNKSHFLCWRLNLTSYVFLLQSSSIVIRSALFQTNFIMSSRSFTEERFEKFRTRFSQISDADSSKSRTESSSAASFIHEDDESFAETIIFLVFYEIWKAWSLVLDKETDQLYELDKQQEDEIKELKTRLQTKENTSSDFIYSERSRSQRNRYSLSLIDEIIDKIVSCKHLTRLNIISAFNKLRMHFDSENYITFITALEAYKYKMLSFKLTNESIFFQQYMNDVLWDFLNDFCQVYLDDILIYSKMRKKHRDHVKLVLR